MDSPSEIKAQLQSLRIAKDQRPGGGRAARRRRGGRLLAWLLVLGGAATAGYLKREPLIRLLTPPVAAAEIKVVTVAYRTEPAAGPVLTATGKIVSDHRVQVTTKVSGQITSLAFEQGDRVDKGQRLATIEDVIYRARRNEAAARVEKAKASLVFQRYNYERVSGLVAQKTAAQIEFAEATRLLRESEAQLAADEAALEFAQKALDDCKVVAPIAGVVLERNVEVGDFVAAEGGRGANANAQFALIADMAKLRVEVDVSELDIGRLHPDMPCTVTPDAYKDRKYRGYVMWIDPGANYSKATVQVKVRIVDPDDRLRVEGSAQVTFLPEATATGPASQAAPSIWIPASACAADAASGTARVFVVTDGRLRRRDITVGRRQAGQVEVLAGLSPGDSIAGEKPETLTDGQPVRF
jgi:HlyD family secretion protein